MKAYRNCPLILVVLLHCGPFLFSNPLPLLNEKSGISLTFSGTNGADWAVEHSYHDPAIADQLIYVTDSVAFHFAHNERNSLMNRTVKLDPVPGINGADGIPRSGDEGDLYVKIDRDLQSHDYSSVAGTLPDWVLRFPEPFRFTDLSYDGSTPVLGSVGDNGDAWGSLPRKNPDRFAMGQRDAFGNEWHTVTYWDDDGPVYKKAGVNPHRQAASDGHWVYVCVNPVTPVLQFSAPEGEQFYTTPLKTWFIPKTWERESYVTGGVTVHFINLTNQEPVQYKIGEGKWLRYDGRPFPVRARGKGREHARILLSFRNGESGPVATRQITVNPAHPTEADAHGKLLWPTAEERAYHLNKLQATQPFAAAYNALSRNATSSGDSFSGVRGGWRSGANSASSALNHAFVAAVEGPGKRPEAARHAKALLLRLARLEPVGNEADVNRATPSKDYLNELSQTIQQYADAAIAYDLLAGSYRAEAWTDGITPIEHLRIRDGLAEVVKSILQVRSNWSFQQGGGDTHWAHGFELMFGITAAAMPDYNRPCFGVSGAFDPEAEAGLWAPFPDQAVTWWEAATNPDINTPGFPGIRYPFRAEMVFTDDGWWVGPNDFQGDGDRYFTNARRQLVDLNYGGMANAECRVEVVEMAGYEAPFVERLYVLDHIRRVHGDNRRPPGALAYMRRRVMGGFTPLRWDKDRKIYETLPPRFDRSFAGFTLRENGARYPQARAAMTELLTDIARFYKVAPGTASASADHTRKSLTEVYSLALCAHPGDLPPPESEANFAPVIKPLMKQIVRPGEPVFKTVIAQDFNEDPLKISVQGLPSGAEWDPATRSLSWTPNEKDIGVYPMRVRADDGTAVTEAPFWVAVKADAPQKTFPAAPSGVRAEVQGDAVLLEWTASPDPRARHTLVYRDGVPRLILDARVTSYRDPELLPGTHTRYALSTMDESGGESVAVAADRIIHRPLD